MIDGRLRTKRWLLAIALLVGALGSALVADSVSAAPPIKTVLKLTCDHNASNVGVFINLTDGITFSPTLTLSCGPDSVSRSKSETLIDTQLVGFTAVVFTGTWVTAAGTGPCVGSSPLPAKLPCEDPNGVGATLVVR